MGTNQALDPKDFSPDGLPLFLGDPDAKPNAITPEYPWATFLAALGMIAEHYPGKDPQPDDATLKQFLECAFTTDPKDHRAKTVLDFTSLENNFLKWRGHRDYWGPTPAAAWRGLIVQCRHNAIIDQYTNPEASDLEYKDPWKHRNSKPGPEENRNAQRQQSTQQPQEILTTLLPALNTYSAKKDYYDRIKRTPLYDFLFEDCRRPHSPDVWKFMFDHSNRKIAQRDYAFYTCGLEYVARSLNIGIATVQRSVAELKRMKVLIRRKAPDYEHGICSHYIVAVSTFQMIRYRTNQPGRKKTTSQDAPGQDFKGG
jgi:hypothetical protein